MLYQGTLLMSVLNWTGLVVNGLVAFLLPMVLALKSTEIKSRRSRSVQVNIHTQVHMSKETVGVFSRSSSSAEESSPLEDHYGNNNHNESQQQIIELTTHATIGSKDYNAANRRKNSSGKDDEDEQEQQARIHRILGYGSLGANQKENSQLTETELSTRRQRIIQDDEEKAEQPRQVSIQDNEQSMSAAVIPANQLIQNRDCFSKLVQSRLHRTRVMSSSTVQPLPIELEVYRREIVLFMIMSFATIIIMTIMEDALEGITPVENIR
jgi:hypothetical protein